MACLHIQGFAFGAGVPSWKKGLFVATSPLRQNRNIAAQRLLNMLSFSNLKSTHRPRVLEKYFGKFVSSFGIPSELQIAAVLASLLHHFLVHSR